MSDKEAEYERLSRASTIDFARVKLDFDGFRSLAKNTNLTADEKVGFGPNHRRGYEDVIIRDIRTKLIGLNKPKKVVVDVGCGMGSITDRFADLCHQMSHRLILVDSEEMLSGAPSGDWITKVAGRYPDNFEAVLSACGGCADIILSYSVLQYIFVESNVFSFVDSIVSMLDSGGAALLGDIPNASKRKRYLASAGGQAFHREFMRTEEAPVIRPFSVERDAIDDFVLAAIVARAHAAGCHAYLMPMDPTLPMSNRRDDLLFLKP